MPTISTVYNKNSVVVNELESEELKARSVVGAYQPELKQLSEVSFSKASQNINSFDIPAPIKPRLERPIGLQVLETTTGFEEAIKQDIFLITQRLINETNRSKDLSKEEKEALIKKFEAAEKSASWQNLTGVLNSISSATAIVFGLSLINPALGGFVLSSTALSASGAATSTWLGAVLIGSGIANISTAEIIPRLDGYNLIAKKISSDEEKQKEIASTIQTALTIVSLATSLAAGFGARSLLNFSQKTFIEIFQTAANLATGTSSLMEGASKRKELLSDSKLTLAQGNQSYLQTEMKEQMTKLRESSKTLGDIDKAAQRVLENEDQRNQLIQG